MRLYDLVDPYVLDEHIKNGFVSVQKHPRLPLLVYNYTPKAQYEGKWGDGTIDYCRGLIVHNDGDRYEIISRPFKKFHNLNTESIPETWEVHLPVTTPTVTMKLDGSLGIYWYFDGQEGIATRGSFTSPQATWATNWYNQNKKEFRGTDTGDRIEWPYEETPLFEIIYKENRIVVDYDFEGLVLIGLVINKTGQESSYAHLKEIANWNKFEVVDNYSGFTLSELCALNNPNEEGFVVTYDSDVSPVKVKIKMEDYVRLHKIVTGMNPRSIWERLSTGQGLDRMSSFPEHFQKWFKSWKDKLEDEYRDILTCADLAFAGRPCKWVFGPDSKSDERRWRAEFARYVSEYPQNIRSVLFAMYDAKDPDPFIWRQIKPRGDDKAFRTEGE